ncbi:MAG TPA: hypothetical protein VK200_09380 [Candidatus Limnocylindrales bacterium]|nr:hypothetical protein [Candidatus Limnocylindrales bacterium]
MLRKIDTEQLVLAAVRSRHGDESISIAPDRTIERPFGWLFFLTSSNAAASSRVPSNFPRQVIVNRYSSQIVASSIEYTPEQFIKIYEELLAQHEAHEDKLRLTTSSPTQWKQWWDRRVARQAAQSGLYQLGGKEKER